MNDLTTSTNNAKKDIVQVKNLVKYFPVHGGVFQRVVAWVKAVEDVNFTIK